MTTMAATPKSASNIASHGHRFVVNLSFGLASKATHFVVSLFLVAYVLRQLGPERFGLVVIASTMVAFIGLIQSGASAGLGRHLAIFHARGDTASFNAYYSAGTALSIAIAAAIATALALLLTILWSWTQVPASSRNDGQWVLAALGTASVCSCLTLPAIACLQAAHRIDACEKINLAGILLRGLGVVLLFESLGPTPQGYAAILLLEQLVVSVATIAAIAQVLPDAKLSFRHLTPKLLRDVAGFNLLNLVANLNYVAFMQSPAFILQRFEGLAIAGFYGIGLQLNNLVRGLLQPVLGALYPATASLHASDRLIEFRRIFLLSTKCFTAAACMLWVLFYFLREPLLMLWLRRDVSPLVEALPWLIAASATGVVSMPASIFSLMLGRMKLPAVSGLVLAMAMSVSFTVLSASNWQPGLVRAGICLTGFFGLYQFVRVLEVSAALKVQLRECADLLLRAIAPAACATIVFLLTGILITPVSSLETVCVTIVATLASLGCANWTLFSASERSLFTDVLNSRRKNYKEAD